MSSVTPYLMVESAGPFVEFIRMGGFVAFDVLWWVDTAA